jgi:hypothetical protein
MTTQVCKYLSLSVALALAACGDDTNTSASGTAGASTGVATGGSTTNSSNPTSSGSTTDSGGSMSASGTTMGGTDPTTSASGTTTTTTGTTTTTTATTGSTGAVGETEPMTSTSTTTTGTTTTEGGSTSTTTTGPDTTGDNTTGQPICNPGDSGGNGMVEKSYIWIASEDSGQISKVNTQTLVEEARYRTGPNGGSESPSRTSVSHDGRFTVVNDRGTGRSTMIAANLEDCIDKNGNGMIDTSKAANDIKAWGGDECVIWSITFPFGGAWQHGPRGTTWTPGAWNFDTCAYDDPKVWIGYFSNAGNNTVHFVRVDGDTGVVEATIPAPAWNGSGFAPYGGALDTKFRPWFSSLRGEIARVNVEDNPVTVTRISPPGYVQSYGMTVDQDGNPWIGGCSGPVSTYDVEANQWFQIAGTNACHRGIGASEKYVWVASNGPCGLVQVDRKTRTLLKKHTPPQCNTAIGISIDLEGYLWLVDHAGYAWKIDQENVQWNNKVIIPGGHYVYSDMTGGQVASILPQ